MESYLFVIFCMCVCLRWTTVNRIMILTTVFWRTPQGHFFVSVIIHITKKITLTFSDKSLIKNLSQKISHNLKPLTKILKKNQNLILQNRKLNNIIYDHKSFDKHINIFHLCNNNDRTLLCFSTHDLSVDCPEEFKRFISASLSYVFKQDSILICK